MRWILALSVGAALVGGAAWRLTRPTSAPPQAPQVDRARQAARVQALWDPGACVLSLPIPVVDVIEPILVFPEGDGRPTEEPLVVTVAADRALADGPTAARPEIGREPRRWMAYAPEDVELARRRKAAWERLVAEDLLERRAPARDLEETAEPPILIESAR